VCDWCGADLDLPFEKHETMEIVTEHDDKTFHVIIVDGEERHRCEIAPGQTKSPGSRRDDRR
jgi:hypothetical protein